MSNYPHHQTYAPHTITLEVFFGVSSPWAFLGAPRLYALAAKHHLTLRLRPILVIQENGGIPLAQRTPARLAYHALDLRRTADHLGVALVGKPRVYPGTPIQLAAQAICRLQHELGWGHALALDFTLAVQRSLWVEEGNVYDLEHLKDLARRVGIEEEMVGRTVVDRLTDEDDEGVKQWKENLRVAEDLGCFGTPNYCVNGEIFWGQDRLDYVERRVEELLEQGFKAL